MATAPGGIAQRSSRKAQLNGQTAEMPGVAMNRDVRKPGRDRAPAWTTRCYFSASATWRFTAMKLSGLTEIESMPHSTRNAANSG